MTDPQTVRIEQVDVELVLPLRQRVLRPHQTVAELMNPGDHDPDTAHLAALLPGPTAAATVVGTASVRRDPPPWRLETDAAGWRLRGMASDPAYRGQGIGTSLLAAAFEHARNRSGGPGPAGRALLWCNARVSALGFYERAGLRTEGDPWEEPAIGPHVRMWRFV